MCERLLRFGDESDVIHLTSTVVGSLHFKHGCISAAERKELRVATFFDQLAPLQHDDAIRHPNGGESM